jgi:hypothetical protein
MGFDRMLKTAVTNPHSGVRQRSLRLRPQPSFQPTKRQRISANTRPVKGVVAKVFTSKSENTFLNIGASYANQTFTGWIRRHHHSQNHRCSPASKAAVITYSEALRLEV